MEEKPTPPDENVPGSRAALLDLLIEMRQRDRLLQQYIKTRSRIHNHWIFLVGLRAVIAGLWMSQLIHQMMDDMAIMSTKMVAMEGFIRNMEGAIWSPCVAISHR
jgi:aminoglycoside phosphotransferase (APT) family kinase protein